MTTQFFAQFLSIPTNYTFPSECGLGIINLASSTGNSTDNIKAIANVTNANLAVFCGGCKPGFYPTPINNSNPHIAIKCTVIQNCDNTVTQILFNACTKCQAGYIFQYDGTNIMYSSCVKYSYSNCYAGKVDNNQVKCSICNKGYYLNDDQICMVRTAPLCIKSELSQIQPGFVYSNEIDLRVFFYP